MTPEQYDKNTVNSGTYKVMPVVYVILFGYEEEKGSNRLVGVASDKGIAIDTARMIEKAEGLYCCVNEVELNVFGSGINVYNGWLENKQRDKNR
jgi:hypothetical protein